MKYFKALFVTVVLCIILAMGVGCSDSSTAKDDRARIASGKIVDPSSYAGACYGSIDAGQIASNYQKGIEPPGMVEATSAEEAEKITGIKIRYPNLKLTGGVKAIYPEKSASANWQIAIHFYDGVMVSEEKWEEEIDYSQVIAQTMDPATHEKPANEGSVRKLVDVAGHQGQLLPEPAVRGADGELIYLQPQVEWWDNGIRYHMLPWNTNFTGDDLLKIANSMYE